MFCNQCGHEIPDNSKFCNNCGEKIQKDSVIEENKKDSAGIIAFLIIALLIVTLGVVCIVGGNMDGGNIPSLSLNSRDATNDDIIAKVENRVLTIQASEKINDLVVEVKYLDKNKNILKTETINVGNIAPGNVFEYKLTLTGMQISDLDKINSFSIKVIDGAKQK